MTEETFSQEIPSRQVLRSMARRYIRAKYRNDLDDMVQQALLVSWINRDRIVGPVAGYIYGCVRFTALAWRQAIKAPQEVFIAECSELRAREPNPEESRIFQDDQKARERRVANIRQSLTPTLRKNLDDWVSRDFRNSAHSQECSVGRLKLAVRRLHV
jgi:hypothetical protein